MSLSNSLLINKTSIKPHFGLVYVYLIILLVFGFFLYDVIGFPLSDELLEIGMFGLLGVYLFENRFMKPKRDFYIFVSFFLFSCLYSILISSNKIYAILFDLLVQIKPYIGFFVIYYLGVVFSDKKKKLLSYLSILFFAITLLVVLVGVIRQDLFHTFCFFFNHPSRFSSALFIIGMLYLYASDFNKKNILFFFVMMFISLLSGKAKTLGLFVMLIALFIIKLFKIQIKFNLRTIILLSFFLVLLLVVTWDKLFFYFISFNIEDENSLARPFLYLTAFRILIDYFPFGTGLASFATHFSGTPYSDVYYKYELNEIWGLLPQDPAFVGDTYYPSLAQFGFLGLILFILFWRRILNETKKYKTSIKYYLIVVSILFYLLIESVADSTFTTSRGQVCMIILALCLNEMRFRNQEKVIVES